MTSVEMARLVRRHAVEMVARAKASHIGGALSMADILAVLYSDILRIRPLDPHWSERDRLVLSKGHCCTSLYAALALRGFFPVKELEMYGADGSRLMAHISHHVPGVEFSTGSLGHGLPFACGKALAAKRRGCTWRTFAILSDGELDEGSNWEAILFAPHHCLENLVVIIDYNKIQSLGSVAEVMELHPLADKFRAFRWDVVEVDGHNHDDLRNVLSEAQPMRSPRCIIAHTVKGKGVPFMENNLLWHYRSPSPTELHEAHSGLLNPGLGGGVIL